MKKIFLLLLTVIFLIYLFYPCLVFVVEDVDNNKILLRKNVESGFEFATLIRHSVQRTPVYEFYQVNKDGTILVTCTKLQDLGWGMPSNLEYKVRFEDDFMIMDNINRSIEYLPFRISFIAEPQLVFKDKKIDLRKYSEDSNLINIYVKKMPLFFLWLRGEINVFQEKI